MLQKRRHTLRQSVVTKKLEHTTHTLPKRAKLCADRRLDHDQRLPYFIGHGVPPFGPRAGFDHIPKTLHRVQIRTIRRKLNHTSAIRKHMLIHSRFRERKLRMEASAIPK